jgi:hypothetical protein
MNLRALISWLMKHITVDLKKDGGAVNYQWEGDLPVKKGKEEK